MLLLIDKVDNFSLTQRVYFTRWVNYTVLSNHEHFSYFPQFPQWIVKANDWNRFASILFYAKFEQEKDLQATASETLMI